MNHIASVQNQHNSYTQIPLSMADEMQISMTSQATLLCYKNRILFKIIYRFSFKVRHFTITLKQQGCLFQ